MKARHLIAASLSLALMACSQAPQLSSTPVAPAKVSLQPAQAPAAEASKALPADLFQARLTRQKGREQLALRVQMPKGFRSHFADPSQLAYVQVSVEGEGLAAPVYHDGYTGLGGVADYLPVVAGQASATISNLRVEDEGVRVVRVRGFDADMNPLPAFEAMAWYVSENNLETRELTVSRRYLLLGRVLASLLMSESELLDEWDEDDIMDLQLVLEFLQDYRPGTGSFGTQPEFFDVEGLISLLPSSGEIPDPIALTDAMARPASGILTINTPLGYQLGEDLTLTVDDPSSPPVGLVRGIYSGSSQTVSGLSPGTWTLNVRDSSDTIVATTSVTVDDGDVTFGSNPLNLTGVLDANTDFQANSETVDFQSDSDIAMDAAGNFVIVWHSDEQDGDSFGVYGQRYNSLGVPQGSEFRINTYTTGAQTTPVVAMADDGSFVVSWSSDEQDGDNLGIYARLYTSAGVAPSTEFRVNTTVAENQRHPEIAMGGGGDFVIVWNSFLQDGDSDGVYARRYDAAGAALSGELPVNATTVGNQFLPRVGMNDNGDFVVAWESADVDGNGIIFQRFSGGAASGPETQANNVTVSNQSAASVAMADNGNFVIAWESVDGSNEGISARRFNNAGNAFGAEFRLNAYTTGAQRNPAIAMEDSGEFVIAWQSTGQLDAFTDIYARHFSATGVAESGEVQVNPYTIGTQNVPSIAVDSDGDFAVSWDSFFDQDGDGNGVFARLFSAAMGENNDPRPPAS